MVEIIPALEVKDGKCVRLSQSNENSEKLYNEDPIEVAKAFEANGIRRLHVVDLDGASSHHVVNYRTLDKIAGHTSLIIDFGGGVKSDEDLVIAFDNGAQMVTVESVAVKSPKLFEKWLHQYGSERIILGADVMNNHIALNGWKEDSNVLLSDFLNEYTATGITKVLCTDVSKDNSLNGPSIELYKDILQNHPEVFLIASGGIGSIDDIYQLEDTGIPAVILGRALYEGEIKLKDLIRFI